MFLLRRIFCKKRQTEVHQIPTWEEIVEHMQGLDLSGYPGDVVQVIPSLDRSKRIIILKNENSCYQVIFEEIKTLDEDEWANFRYDVRAYPAWWEPMRCSFDMNSFYGTIEDALRETEYTYEYKTFFVK